MTAQSPTIVYFGNDWFAENRTSSHHVARQLAAMHPIHYIECPGLRAPKASGRDARKLLKKLWRLLRSSSTVDGNVTVTTLPQIPFHRFGFVRALNRRLGRAWLRLYLWRKGVRRPITWFVVPHAGHLCGALGEELSVYYCIDDYAALPDVDVAAVRAMDEELTRKANVVFVASETLLEQKRSLNPQTFHSPHGVDVAHFAAASNLHTPVPADLAALPRPIIGFFGLIERWIDLDLVAELARARPDYSFVMIGRVAVPDEQVPRLSNLHFLGRRPYDDLPAYGRGFDCCLIPYRLTQQVIHANPLKLREYLAMGKPVVSVSTPEIDRFADVVAISRNRDEFLKNLDLAVTAPANNGAAAGRIARVAGMSWQARVEAAWNVASARIREQALA